MIELSMVTALDLWTELVEAYYGENGFGGDTAEIYVYRLMEPGSVELRKMYHEGKLTGLGDDVEATYRKANRSLLSLIVHFEEKFPGARVFVNERDPREVLADSIHAHRWHVRVGHRWHVRVGKRKRVAKKMSPKARSSLVVPVNQPEKPEA